MTGEPASASMFSGLSAFPLTPLNATGTVDEPSFARLVARLAAAGVDSIGALGSTGSYAYLGRAERARAVRVAVDAADSVPVMVGIGAVRTEHVLTPRRRRPAGRGGSGDAGPGLLPGADR